MKREITNTQQEAQENPLMKLWVGGVNPGGIEAQEAAGQRELVESAQLPTDGSENEIWTKWGVIFGEKTPGDPIFRSATLPPGWKKESSDHAMWSYLVDEKGRRRAGIFYKAAFYDRNAHIGPEARFRVGQRYSENHDRWTVLYEAKDGNTVLFSTEPQPVKANDWHALDAAGKEHAKKCSEWLDANRPGWKDPIASWDIP